MSKQYKVFVFGTLKQGFPNFHLNSGIKQSGEFQTASPYPLYLVGERFSPWLMDDIDKGEHVFGELYLFDKQGLGVIDRLERIDEADGYRRQTISIINKTNELLDQVFAYLKPTEQLQQASIRSGPFSEYSTQHSELFSYRR